MNAGCVGTGCLGGGGGFVVESFEGDASESMIMSSRSGGSCRRLRDQEMTETTFRRALHTPTRRADAGTGIFIEFEKHIYTLPAEM